MKFWVLKPNYGGLAAKAAGGTGGLGAEPPVFGDFCSFLINTRYTAFWGPYAESSLVACVSHSGTSRFTSSLC